jgi:hypothetical protein
MLLYFLLFSCSFKVCEKIRGEDGLELLANVVKNPDTRVEQLEKVTTSNIVCLIF